MNGANVSSQNRPMQRCIAVRLVLEIWIRAKSQQQPNWIEEHLMNH
jgi:hypothetical protein